MMKLSNMSLLWWFFSSAFGVKMTTITLTQKKKNYFHLHFHVGLGKCCDFSVECVVVFFVVCMEASE